MAIERIKNPLGVTAFGSGLVSAPADIAVINLSVESSDPSAKKAFQQTKKTSQGVRKYLDRLKNAEVSTSHIALSQSWSRNGNKVDQFNATISYRIKLTDIDIMEKVITSAIGAGANRIQSVQFQNSDLKTYRKEARRLAVASARAKAENYCDAAGVEIGDVIHIEDMNPDQAARRGYSAESSDWMSGGDDGGSMNPGDLPVSGAVKIIFSLKGPVQDTDEV